MQHSQKKFLKNMVGFSMVTWISFVLGFIASPISTRLFAPEELAKVGLFSNYATLFSSVCYLGLDQAFVRFFRELPGRLSRRALLTLCMGVALLFSVLSSLLLSLFWQGVSAEIVGMPDLSIFLCLCIYTFGLVTFRFLALCYRMEQNALLYTIQGVAHVLLTKLAYLCVGFGDPRGRSAIILLTVLGTAFSAAFLIFQRRHFHLGGLRDVTRSDARALGSFALPLVPLSILSWMNTSLSQVMLKQLLGFAAAGIYASALGLASTINIVQTGFNTYWSPYVLENYQGDDRRRFYTVHRLMACLLTLFGLCITLLQTPVFLLLGKAYRSAVSFFPFLFLSPICYCLGETTGIGINISKKTYWTTIIYLFSAISNIVLCLLFVPMLGMAGAALAAAVSAILTLILRTFVGERYYKVLQSYRYLWYTIGLMLAASFGNLWLPSPYKYLWLACCLAAACLMYRSELRTLFTALSSLLGELRRRMTRRKE